jgi:hypothetical protein
MSLLWSGPDMSHWLRYAICFVYKKRIVSTKMVNVDIKGCIIKKNPIPQSAYRTIFHYGTFQCIFTTNLCTAQYWVLFKQAPGDRRRLCWQRWCSRSPVPGEMSRGTFKYACQIKQKNIIYGFFFFLCTLSTLLHLPPLRFHCVGGCWDRTQDCCDFGIDSQTL